MTLEEDFKAWAGQAAAADANGVHKDLQAQMYGLYKVNSFSYMLPAPWLFSIHNFLVPIFPIQQATKGDNTKSKPSMFDVVGQYFYHPFFSWKSFSAYVKMC